MAYGSWDMEQNRHNFLSFSTISALLPPTHLTYGNPENQNFGKMKKIPEGIIILQLCIIDDSHMMYGFWDMKCNRQNFLSIWTIFLPFTPLPPPPTPPPQPPWKIKIKNLKNWKKSLEVLSFHTCVPYGHKKWHIEVGAPPKNHWLYIKTSNSINSTINI